MWPDRRELPATASPATVRPSLLHGAALLIGTLALIYAATALYRWATEPIAMTSPAPRPAAASGATSTFPPEILQMAVAVSTSLAPSPSPVPPTPTYAPLPTPRPAGICLTSTPRGSVCTQPMPPLPTATPILPCPVMPGELCIGSGGPVIWLTATPTMEP
jgi:hypothetical protein